MNLKTISAPPLLSYLYISRVIYYHICEKYLTLTYIHLTNLEDL